MVNFLFIWNFHDGMKASVSKGDDTCVSHKLRLVVSGFLF